MAHQKIGIPKQRGPARVSPPNRWLEVSTSPAALCLVAVALALALYWRTLGFEFIDLDDTAHILANPHVLGGLTWANVRWAFADLAGMVDYWHPVSWLSLMLDATLYGQWAGGYHATNFLLHAANVALVFLLVRTVTSDKWSAFAVAVFFAVHPLHLESVAWITERKDVLFMFWGLLAIHVYLAWAMSRSRSALAAFYCCYALSLMSKPVLVVLPGILLLLDYWPLGRWSPYELFQPAGSAPSFSTRLRALWPLLREKLPMVGLAALSTLMTVFTSLRMYDLVVVDAPTRFGNAFLSLSKYVWKLFVPTDLAILYPFQMHLPVWPLALSIAAFCAALLLVLWQGKRFPWLIFGAGWFLLGLLTTIVVPKTGVQIPLADRFTYFPYVGAYLVLVLGARELASRLIADRRKRHMALAACLLALFGWYWTQADYAIGFWRNKFTIYERALDVTPGNHILFNNYAKLLLDRMDGVDIVRAETYVLKALALQPNYNLAQGNLGNIYSATGRYEQAIEMYQKALAHDKNYVYSADDHYSIGYCLAQLHRYDEAEKYYREALAIRPNYPQAHNDLGNIALLRGDLRSAEEHYAKAVALAPDYRAAQENLASVRARLAGGRQ
jgi:Tfp pilus assembly protein PilF